MESESNKPLSKEDLDQVVEKIYAELDIRDRKYRFKTYQKCFVGKDLVKLLISLGYAEDVQSAVEVGNMLLSENYFHHVVKDHAFKNEHLFYRFIRDEKDRGHTENNETWHSVLGFLAGKELNAQQFSEALAEHSDFHKKTPHVPPILFDEHNADMMDNVRPIKWVDPEADKKYDMVVIGAGAGGLVSAIGSAGVGAKVAMIERNYFGGDCLVTGCVPSKAFIKSAHVAHTSHNSEEFGVEAAWAKVNFKKVMERMRMIRSQISANDSVHRCAKQFGIDVFLGDAKFTAADQISVNGQVLQFSKAVIAVGGAPATPDIEGLNGIPYFNSENVFNLTELPKKIVIVGSGPIGSELGQSFQRLGSEVTMLERGKQFLPREDPDAAQFLQDQMAKDGVQLLFDTKPQRFVLKSGDATKWSPETEIGVEVQSNGEKKMIDTNAVIIAAGRVANTKNLGCEVAGVELETNGAIKVSDTLRTTNKNIYSVGDCAAGYQFTHNSDIMARYVIRNALFFGSMKYSEVIMPWCTYTDPEIAHVGLYPRQMEERKIKYDTYVKDYGHLDRAICEGVRGMMKVHTKEGTDEILGATIVGGPAGDMISQVTQAMFNKLGLSKMGACVHPYPTYAEGFRALADQVNKKKLTPGAKVFLRKVIAARR